ncbi:glycosyltransferase [Christiangramia echinicola]|uniref:glycosyltransferase n=1 Tax=Christiangramia echinicola TaxID=279359 RepID=UPI00047DA0BD|nr:glycosyltransferase [Christiangramia echinicola]
MEIVIFVHPEFIKSQSMPRYARMLYDGMKNRGHKVDIWTAKGYFSKLPAPSMFNKWLGYLDQFLLFPVWVKFKLFSCSSRTLFVFADHALGPWIPLVSRRPLVVHCHDFMAQKSAMGKIPENKVKATGRLYQTLIRKGYRKGRCFISISEKTKKDLHQNLNTEPKLSEVVYNGLNQNFHPCNDLSIKQDLSRYFQLDLQAGYILHVGGNQFYKNRGGVIEIYDLWRELSRSKLPLILIGTKPTEELLAKKKSSKYCSSIYFLCNVSDEDLRLFYQGAEVFLFPSLEEGFGWPIAEAMASGCPVITTNEPPMTEVGGPFSYYIPKKPLKSDEVKAWAKNAAILLEEIIRMPLAQRNDQIQKGLDYVKRFDAEESLEHIESIYKEVHQICQI